jgi:hypothetical protein
MIWPAPAALPEPGVAAPPDNTGPTQTVPGTFQEPLLSDRGSIDRTDAWLDNTGMEIPGRVQNGVVVLQSETVLPEGAAVTVHYPGVVASPSSGKKRIQVPLVRTGQPGSVNLTSERIGTILDEEDAAPRR